MTRKVTEKLIQQMAELYLELGTYSAVAKELSLSASTVSKYLKKHFSIKHYDSYCGPQSSLPTKESIQTFSFLTEEEEESYNKFWKEL